ncbi:hypothetical protein ACSBOX_11585 [Arthrobacter sp. KN11-1C]|uniref:hypothetical protein n=1 Tax=Arthrobacter sp. KN11-1C TaxID=3445774 RepID=UPI003F9FE51B
MPLPDKDATTGVMGAINAFGNFLTPTIYVGVLSFLAYVIGMLLMVDIKAGSVIRLGRRLSLPYISRSDLDVINAHIESAFHRARVRRVNGFEIEREFRLRSMIDGEGEYQIFHTENQGNERMMDDEWREYSLKELRTPVSEEIVQSIPSLAIKLQDKNPLLYGSYDRDRSESEFRLSIAPPIAMLSAQFIILGMDRTLTLWPWAGYIGLIAVVALVVKGFQKRFSSVNVVVTALEIGTIESQMISRLEAVPADKYDDKPEPASA